MRQTSIFLGLHLIAFLNFSVRCHQRCNLSLPVVAHTLESGVLTHSVINLYACFVDLQFKTVHITPELCKVSFRNLHLHSNLISRFTCVSSLTSPSNRALEHILIKDRLHRHWASWNHATNPWARTVLAWG